MYKSTMYRLAFGYLGDADKALEAVDEAVYLGYVHRKELREPVFFKTWLTRILINECYRLLRMGKREVIMEVLPEHLAKSIIPAAYPGRANPYPPSSTLN